MAREKVLTGSLGNCEPLYSVRLTRSNSGRTARTHHLVPCSLRRRCESAIRGIKFCICLGVQRGVTISLEIQLLDLLCSKVSSRISYEGEEQYEKSTIMDSNGGLPDMFSTRRSNRTKYGCGPR